MIVRAMSSVNLRSRTGEERRRQTLCDKRDNKFVWNKFSPKFTDQKTLMLVKIATKHARNSLVLLVTRMRFTVLFFLPSCCVDSLLFKIGLWNARNFFIMNASEKWVLSLPHPPPPPSKRQLELVLSILQSFIWPSINRLSLETWPSVQRILGNK